MKSHDKDRTDEKLWNYVHITRDKRLGLSDTKIGGDMTVSRTAFIDALVANKIGIDSSGNDLSGFGQFTDLSSTSLNVFGDTNIYGNLNVNSIFKRTITEVDIDISGNLELFHDLDVSGVITGIGGIDLHGVGDKDKINNVTIGHDVSGMAKFTDLSTNRLDSVNLNSISIGLDASGYGAFNNLEASTMTTYDNLIIGNNSSNPHLSSRGNKSISLVTNSGTNSSEIKINYGQNQDIQMIPDGTGKLVIGNGTNRGYITTNQTQNLLLDTNSGTTTGFIKIISGSNGNIQFAPNGSGAILIGNGINHQTITTSGAKNLTLNTTNNTSTPSVVINAGTVGNIDLKHNTLGMVIVGNSSVSGKITTNGQQDLLLSTYSNNSMSSKINIKNDVSGNIQLLTSGTGGKVEIGNGTTTGEITSNGTYDLKLTTNNDIDSGFIKIEDGQNGNIEITPHGTGNVVLGGSIDFPGHDGSRGLKLNGVLVTADSNEINRLDGSAPGTIVASRVPIYDSGGNLNMKRLILDGITVNLTANELNVLDGCLPGIVVNNKAVVYSDAGKINATQLQLSGVSITSSASEINYLDGSSPENIANNRAVIYGPNGEINLSILQLNGTQLYLGNELSFLNGSLSGTIVNSKAVIYSSTGDVTATKLIVGSGGASSEVTSNGSYDITIKTGNATTGTIKINNGANGNIEINPNGTGKIISSNNITTTGGVTFSGTIKINSLIYPSTDGTSNQVLKTDGAGNLSFLSLTLDNLINVKTDTNSIFIGSEPASLNSTNKNTSIGIDSLLNLTTGTTNTAIGYKSLNSNQTGYNNIAIGSQSLETLTTGYNNIVVGEKAGDLITAGSNNIIIGNNSDPSLLNSTNEIVIGNNAIGHGNNITVIGNSSTTSIDPSTDNSVDLGSTSYSYRNIFLKGSINLNGSDYLSNITNSTITNSDITVGTGKTIDIQNGTLITSNSQNASIVENVGQNIDIGSYNLKAETITSDVATGTAPFTVNSTTQVQNLFATKAQVLESSPSTTIYSTGIENVMSSGNVTISNGKLEHTFTIPAGTIITDIFGVFTTSLTVDAGTPKIKIGSTTNDSEYLTDTSLSGNESRGFNFNGTMGIATPINKNYFSSQSDIIITILSDGGNLTAGIVKIFLKFVV